MINNATATKPPNGRNYLTSMRGFYEKQIENYPDMLETTDIISITGFSKSAITNWVRTNRITAVHYKKKFLFPKEVLLDFLISPYYLSIIRKTDAQRQTLTVFHADCMEGDNKMIGYEDLLKKYPEYITKEQLYKIAHVSKRTAQSLLEMGLVKHVDTGKKTRRYTIAMVDVVSFLEDRDRNPAKYGRLRQQKVVQCVPEILTLQDKRLLKKFYFSCFEEYPDVVDVKQASEMTGHTHNRIRQWCCAKKFERFLIQTTYKIPKVSLIEYLISDEYCQLQYRSAKQIDDMKEFIRFRDKA